MGTQGCKEKRDRVRDVEVRILVSYIIEPNAQGIATEDSKHELLAVKGDLEHRLVPVRGRKGQYLGPTHRKVHVMFYDIFIIAARECPGRDSVKLAELKRQKGE